MSCPFPSAWELRHERHHASCRSLINSPCLQSKDQTKAFYNKISRVYDLLSVHSEAPIREAGLDSLNAKAGEKVSEIGFGTGHSLVRSAKGVGPNDKVCGLDLSDQMVKLTRYSLAKAQLLERANLRCGDAAKLLYAEAIGLHSQLGRVAGAVAEPKAFLCCGLFGRFRRGRGGRLRAGTPPAVSGWRGRNVRAGFPPLGCATLPPIASTGARASGAIVENSRRQEATLADVSCRIRQPILSPARQRSEHVQTPQAPVERQRVFRGGHTNGTTPGNAEVGDFWKPAISVGKVVRPEGLEPSTL